MSRGDARVALAVLILPVSVWASCRKETMQATAPALGAPPMQPTPPPQSVRPLPDATFRVEWLGHDVPAVMTPGSIHGVTVTLRNASPLPWPDPDSTGQNPPEAGAVRLASRWRAGAASSPAPAWEPARADLRRLVLPGQIVTVRATVTAPPKVGDYALEFDLLQELIAFFGDKGGATLVVPVRVAGPSTAN